MANEPWHEMPDWIEDTIVVIGEVRTELHQLREKLFRWEQKVMKERRWQVGLDAIVEELLALAHRVDDTLPEDWRERRSESDSPEGPGGEGA